MPRRYIQLADPVYQVQPPRPCLQEWLPALVPFQMELETRATIGGSGLLLVPANEAAVSPEEE